jgi:hypothetical protein
MEGACAWIGVCICVYVCVCVCVYVCVIECGVRMCVRSYELHAL